MEGTIAEIRMFGGNFAPRTWAFCSGQLLPISSNTALFSILGTQYGGDGRTSFALPDMRGRVPIHPGNGPGLTDRRIGEKGGVENVTLNLLEIPAHNHPATIQDATLSGATMTGQLHVSSAAPNEEEADGNNLGTPSRATAIYTSGSVDETLQPGSVSGSVSGTLSGGQVSVGLAGGNHAHTNMQPFLCVNFIICMQGVFPSRS